MSRPKLLLADDSITIQKVVNLTFGDQGMDVFTFSDGESAIERFDEIKPDVVLADVHMPGIGGYQLCELVRSNEASRSTPVLLLVGSFEPFDQEEAARVGANGHLTKPFSSIADLISTVEDLVKPSTGVAEVQERRPDTSDIDSLYEQSFVETVEIPKNGTGEGSYEFAELDDEMIQTSYAAEDSDAEESFYAVDEQVDDPALEDETQEVETDSLIARSVPPVEAVEEMPEAQEPAGDPFASPAAEPPAASSNSEPPREEIRFTMDDVDLLELPSASSPVEGPVAVAGENPSNGLNVDGVSPELIDLIVNKVVERLEQRANAGAAHSVSGN